MIDCPISRSDCFRKRGQPEQMDELSEIIAKWWPLLGDEEGPSENLERLCQAVSPSDEPCDYPATVHCSRCGRWFCDAHAEDEEWHLCVLAPADEGGEA
jgi:hypothetical protein